MWEYKVVVALGIDVLEEMLNDYAKDGWEPVTMCYFTGTQFVAILRRAMH